MTQYQNAQNATFDCFANLADMAKQRHQIVFNTGNGHDFSSFRRLKSALEATDRLLNLSTDYIAFEMDRQPEIHQRLDPALQACFEAIGAIRDEHFDAGPQRVQKRREMLARMEPYADRDRNDEIPDEEVANAINRVQETEHEPLRLRPRRAGPGDEGSVTIARTEREPGSSPGHRRWFTPQTARAFSNVFGELRNELRTRARDRAPFLSGPEAGEFAPTSDQDAVVAQMRTTRDAIAQNRGRLDDRWGENGLTRADRIQQQRDQRARETEEADLQFAGGSPANDHAPAARSPSTTESGSPSDDGGRVRRARDASEETDDQSKAGSFNTENRMKVFGFESPTMSEKNAFRKWPHPGQPTPDKVRTWIENGGANAAGSPPQEGDALGSTASSLAASDASQERAGGKRAREASEDGIDAGVSEEPEAKRARLDDRGEKRSRERSGSFNL